MYLAVVAPCQRGNVTPRKMGEGRDVVEIKIDGFRLHGCPVLSIVALRRYAATPLRRYASVYDRIYSYACAALGLTVPLRSAPLICGITVAKTPTHGQYLLYRL